METTYRNQLEVDRRYLAVLGLARPLTPQAQHGERDALIVEYQHVVDKMCAKDIELSYPGFVI